MKWKLLESLGQRTIFKGSFMQSSLDMFNNYILYENSSDNAMLCNIRGYDLAVLCNKYVILQWKKYFIWSESKRLLTRKSKRTAK